VPGRITSWGDVSSRCIYVQAPHRLRECPVDYCCINKRPRLLEISFTQTHPNHCNFIVRVKGRVSSPHHLHFSLPSFRSELHCAKTSSALNPSHPFPPSPRAQQILYSVPSTISVQNLEGRNHTQRWKRDIRIRSSSWRCWVRVHTPRYVIMRVHDRSAFSCESNGKTIYDLLILATDQRSLDYPNSSRSSKVEIGRMDR
jgi:hypothetical protein